MKTEKRKANVGDRILIVGASLTFGTYKNGDVMTVKDLRGLTSVRTDLMHDKWRNGAVVHHEEYEVIVDMPKPPLGLKPRHIHEYQRREAITVAVERYVNAGLRVPPEWVAEYNELVSKEDE